MLRLISVCIFLSKSKKMSRDPLRFVHVSFAVKCIFIVIVCSMQFFFFIAFFLRSYMCRLHGFNIITWEDHWREKATQIDICKIYGQTKWYNKLGREDVHCAFISSFRWLFIECRHEKESTIIALKTQRKKNKVLPYNIAATTTAAAVTSKQTKTQ